MKKIILLTLLTAIGFKVNAQTKFEDKDIFNTPQNQQQSNKNEIKKSPLTPEIRQTLDGYLASSSYQDFFAFVIKNPIVDEQYIAYLISKKDQGHIPLYWLMANYYAEKENHIEAHKWLYTAMIMTQQDSYLCYDETARNAPRILIRAFPKIIEVTTKSPQHIQPAMSEVSFFLYNVKNRIHPEWVCYYGQNNIFSENEKLIPESAWDERRKSVLDRFTSKYMK